FPTTDVMTLVTPAAANFVSAPGPVISLSPASTALSASSAPGRMEVHAPRVMEQMLSHLQALVSHRIPSGDIVEVLCHALRVAIAHEEKQKFSATSRP